MARSLEELELAFQAEYPKVEQKRKSKKAFRNKTKKAVAKEATKDIAAAQKETIQDEITKDETTKEGIIQKEVTQSEVTQSETTQSETTQNEAAAQQEATQNEATAKNNIQAEELPSDTVSISILDILFYLVLALMVIGAIIFSKEALGNRTIGGRHFYEVTTTSMQRVYPKGSLVFVRDIEPDALVVGDDIIFQSEDNEIIISRITEIKEEPDETNNQVFVTVGVDEIAENSELVPANRVTGKVTGSIPFAGMIFNWIGNNLWAGFAALGVLVITFVCTKIFGRKDKVAKKD